MPTQQQLDQMRLRQIKAGGGTAPAPAPMGGAINQFRDYLGALPKPGASLGGAIDQIRPQLPPNNTIGGAIGGFAPGPGNWIGPMPGEPGGGPFRPDLGDKGRYPQKPAMPPRPAPMRPTRPPMPGGGLIKFDDPGFGGGGSYNPIRGPMPDPGRMNLPQPNIQDWMKLAQSQVPNPTQQNMNALLAPFLPPKPPTPAWASGPDYQNGLIGLMR